MSATPEAQRGSRPAPRYKLSSPVEVLVQRRIPGERLLMDIEGSGSILDISESGAALSLNIAAEEGDGIIIYAEGIGRFLGLVVRTFDGGIGVAFSLSHRNREIIRSRIAAALDGVPYFRLGRERSALRVRYNIESSARIGARAEPIPCRIEDMSKSGCLVQCAEQPPLGEYVMIGILRGTVVRLTPTGFAIEFIRREHKEREPVKLNEVSKTSR